MEPLPGLTDLLPEWRALIARTTKRADDLRAWCRSLVDAGDWKAALPAFEEAAGIVADKDYARGELLDGAALAAKLLAAAPGLGWSNGEHPGHLPFPLFTRLLGGKKKATSPRTELAVHRGMDIEELEAMTADEHEPRLAAPEVDQLLELAGTSTIPTPETRNSVVAAMRKAAERRLAGVTDQKRRRHYGHAAALVGACVSCDPSTDTARWVAALRAEHKRFPALRAELDRAVGAP